MGRKKAHTLISVIHIANGCFMENLLIERMYIVREALRETSQGDYWPYSYLFQVTCKKKELLQIICWGSSFTGNENIWESGRMSIENHFHNSFPPNSLFYLMSTDGDRVQHFSVLLSMYKGLRGLAVLLRAGKYCMHLFCAVSGSETAGPHPYVSWVYILFWMLDSCMILPLAA